MFRRFALASIYFLGFLSLTVVTVSAQSYSPMYSPQSTQSEQWVCLDQYNHGIPYAYFTFYTGVYLNTNSHLHDDSLHPWSSATCTTTSSYQCLSSTSGYANAIGVFSLQLNTTLVGQAEALVISCTNGNGWVQTTDNYAVGYNDLVYNDDSNVWIKIGGSDTGGGTGHGTTAFNRYMKSTPSWGVYYATLDYLAAHTDISQICLNDQALPYGGKFDIGTSTRWASPHSQHDRGTAVDVAGHSSAQCANHGGSGVGISEFISYCVAHGASSTYSFDEGDHAHCGFEAPTWPH